MSDNLGKGEVRGLHVKIPFHNLKIGAYLAEEIICLFVCQVAQAENLTNLAWRKELLELQYVSVKLKAQQLHPYRTFAGMSYGLN